MTSRFNARWVYPFLIAVVFGWLVSRPSGPSFSRLPAGGGTAPKWSMPDLEGRTVQSEDFAGRIVVLNFWATWCPPCRREIPELKEFQRAHSTNDVVVLGAATDADGPDFLKSFVRRHELNYPVLRAGPEVQMTFSVTSLPSTWIIGRDGRVEARYLGALTRKELDRAIAPLLSKGTPGIPPPPVL